MLARRIRFAPVLSTLAVLLAIGGVAPARAGVFDDDEARRQIKDFSIQANERFDTLSKAQFELVNQIQALREDNARLQGQVETLNYELESAKKRQQDFYIDLDGRLRKLEPQSAQASDNRAGEPSGEPGKKTSGDPAAEARDYESALNLFKAGKVKESAVALEAFVNLAKGIGLGQVGLRCQIAARADAELALPRRAP